jgi:transcriptional regulator
MYSPQIFREDSLEVLHSLMRAHPLATLVSAGSGGIKASLLPFSVIPDGRKGVLRVHLAKANDQVADLGEGKEVLVIFQGPEAYITPSWYLSKAEHGKVVPTWNYVVIHARGVPRVTDDHGWLRDQIEDLTKAQEASRAAPWEVGDAPDSFISALLDGIVGVEIPIAAIEGKWKVSQNRSEADRNGVYEGLLREGASEEMAKLVAGQGASCPRSR